LDQTTSLESPRTTGGTPRATDRPGDRSPFALGLMLRRAHDRAAHALSEALRPLGLELRHFAVMIELHQRGPINQRDLGYAVGMDKAMIVRVVDDLEKAGLAIRKPVPGDRRVREVEITDPGVKVFDMAHDNGRPIAEAITAELEPEEQEQLMGLLTRFTYPSTE
jgi:MarR family transcriptional regulator, lower aerobic nicotinate degradation pathway regulator